MTDIAHELQPCLGCGKFVDAATGVFGATTPEPGDVTVCLYCGHLMVFREFRGRLQLDNPTDKEIHAIAGDKRILAVQRTRGKIKEQIFDADKQDSGRGQSDQEVFGSTRCRAGRADHSLPLCATLPGPSSRNNMKTHGLSSNQKESSKPIITEMKARQTAKIRELGHALVDAGFFTIDEQSKALGLARSTTWTILSASHKGSGLSAGIIKRMLLSPQLPPLARRKILEYTTDKLAGAYGGSTGQRRTFFERVRRATPGIS